MSADTPQDLEKKAEKKMKAWFGKQQAFEDAAELYQQAANKYKISRQHMEAGKAYEKAADCLEKSGAPPFDIANQFLEAAKVYKLINFDGFYFLYLLYFCLSFSLKNKNIAYRIY